MLNSKLTLLLLGFIIVLHSFILTKLIYFPYPELFVYPYLTNHGLKPYSQIIDQHFPGLMFLPINFDNLGMNNEVIARMWSVAIVVLTHLLLFYISRVLLKSRKKALIVNTLYLIWQPFFEGWILWIDNFLPLLILPAFYLLYKRKFFLTGLLMGSAVVFKQVMIPMGFIIGAYLFWETKNLKTTGRYFLGLFFPVIFMLAYLVGIEVLSDFWYWTVTFNLTEFAKYGRGEDPSFPHLIRVGLVFGTPFLILRKIKSREVQILLIFFIGTLMGLSTRFDFVHFQPALPFALIATVYVLNSGWKNLLSKFFFVSYLFVLIWWLSAFYRGYLSSKVFFFDEQTKMTASKIKIYTKPYDKIFVFGAPPHLYQMADRLPAGDIFVFQFPWFLKVAESRILEGIIRDKPLIIVSDRTIRIEDQSITEFAKNIDQYILKNYEVIDEVGTTAIMRRRI